MRTILGVCCAVILMTACSGGDDAPPTPEPGLALDQVEPAIAELESTLGGPQRFFEINVRGDIVNLFVATPSGDQVQPWVYVDGELSSRDPVAAQGQTFPGDAVDFDTDTILDATTAELPDAVVQALELLGQADDTVRYTVVMVSSAGGQILVQVTPTGEIVGVDA